MPRSPEQARNAVFTKAASVLDRDAEQLTDEWLSRLGRRLANRDEPLPRGELQDDVSALVRSIATVLDDAKRYRSFLDGGKSLEIGRRIARSHVQADGSLTTALEAYMQLRKSLILASRDVYRDSDRPFFDLMSRLNRCIDRVLFAIAEGYFAAFQDEIENQTITDPLTGLGNSRRFREVLAAELKRSDRTGRPFAVVFVDVDGFKRINDRLGHLAADRVLRAIGHVMAEQLRTNDLVCRWGGDEFVILLPETDLEEAAVVADKLRIAVWSDDRCDEATISLGVSCSPEDGTTYEDLVGTADRALYSSKRRGKNKVTASRSGEQGELAI